jgi:TIR domain
LATKLFISYSRAQTPFVDRLADQLEDRGYSLWLDYHNLIPARPWFPQIEAGIDGAEVVLLIVSKESIRSKNVEPEWKRALDRGKRLVLLIFEAVPLPPGLQTCEWVDFRSDHKRAFQQLVGLIDGQVPSGSPAPQSGFKAPPVFWMSLCLSLVVLIGSIPAWWTLVLPYVLVPLPRQIFQRNYVFHRVIPTLLVLPLVYWLSWWMMFTSPNSIFHGYRWFAMTWFPLSLLAGWLLAGLLLTPDMQRRGLPEAARWRFANPLMLDNLPPRPVLFAIDHALQDERYAEGLREGLKEHGHRLAESKQEPEATFVLVSTYKKQTNYDSEHQAVYPVLLQSVREIDPEIQRIQWIDFRSGIEPAHKLARLLPQPERLLKGLGVPPTGTQEVFPVAVSALQYFILITGLLQGGGLLLSLLALLIWVLRGNSAWGALSQILGVALSGFLLLGTMNIAVNALRSRANGASAFYPLLILNIFQIAISLFSMLVIAVYRQGANLEAEVRLLATASRASAVNWVVLPLAVTIMILILLFRWRELYRWLPRRQGASVSVLESWLLLYTPSKRGVLILHLIFHGLFLLLYALLNVWSIFVGWWFVPYLVFCCLAVLVVMIGIRYWARRLST